MKQITNNIELPNDFAYPELVRAWACFDTETTGFTKWDDVLQLSLIDMNGNTVNEYFNTRPKYNKLKDGSTSITRKRTWKKSMEVHKITPEMVSDKLSMIERKDEFRELFKRYSIIVGYNVAFDVRMITSNIWYNIEYYSAVVDVLDLWKEYKKKNSIAMANDKLVSVSKYFGWDYTKCAHNALADVYATIYVFQKILEEDEEIYMEVLNSKKKPYVKKSYSKKPATKSIKKEDVEEKIDDVDSIDSNIFEDDDCPF